MVEVELMDLISTRSSSYLTLWPQEVLLERDNLNSVWLSWKDLVGTLLTMLMLNHSSMVKASDVISSSVPATALPIPLRSSALEVLGDVHLKVTLVEDAAAMIRLMDADMSSQIIIITVRTLMPRTMPDSQVLKSMIDLLTVSASVVL